MERLESRQKKDALLQIISETGLQITYENVLSHVLNVMESSAHFGEISGGFLEKFARDCGLMNT